MRAVAAQEPDPELRCPDSLARAFVGDLPLARLCDSKPGFRLARWITERRIPGAYWSEVARVKYFDELLLGEVARGVSQVVILGAGLDSRAYRFKDELADVSVFEVDHPKTAARKLDRIRATLGEVPDGVTYVQTDLTIDDLASRLAEHGFDETTSVFVLWCGVTMYLNAEALDDVLGWLADRPSGSSIAFDYDFDAFISGDGRFYGASATRRVVESSGERLSFGLDPAGMQSFLKHRRLNLESNLLPDQIAERYLRSRTGNLAGRPFGFVGMVHARAMPVG
jgi:methyltransferase (TIGR00027 family)